MQSRTNRRLGRSIERPTRKVEFQPSDQESWPYNKILHLEQLCLCQSRQQLEMNVLSAMISLFRKDSITNKIKIDPQTMEIQMFDKFDTKIEVGDLSAGEQQVFAISILWALAKTANRPLPFIVDTPLSRLDSAHRGTLVNNFLTKASHQIFVLSTDTEIDKKYYKALQPHISRAYHLDYNEDTASTEASLGYFWEDGSIKV